LFRWGEAEEWIVLISMSIPPVWPLFRPFTHRFVKSSASRSNPPYGQYGQYGSKTGNLTSTGAPPTVTTTISVSSTKGVSAAAVPVGGSSSAESTSGYSEDEPETPHNVLSIVVTQKAGWKCLTTSRTIAKGYFLLVI
jgi:hypothetical protein